MVLKNIESELVEDGEDGFVYPHYNGYSLANVPNTVMELLGSKTQRKTLNKRAYASADIDGIERVVLFVVDGLGYNMWLDTAKGSGLMQAFKKHGSVQPITTVFPSTTAAAITTINTGLTPLEHGLLEWTLYLEEVGMTVHPLPFTVLSKRRESLYEKGVDPKILYNGNTVYQAMGREGITSATLTGKHISGTAYNRLIQKGSERMPYTSQVDMLIKVRKALENPRGPEYINAYVEAVDTMTHAYGPYTEESREEISVLLYLIEKLLVKKISRSAARKTLMLMIADHGHIKTDPSKTVYLNKYKGIERYYAKGKAGEFIGCTLPCFLNACMSPEPFAVSSHML